MSERRFERQRASIEGNGPKTVATLLVGFDSAWTATNFGALIGIFRSDDGIFHELGRPQRVDYREAERIIIDWQAECEPEAAIVMLDQPTIVKNPTGQRPVEDIVGAAISLRYGGMQPANTGRENMFGEKAPIWPFLKRFGGPADPLAPIADTQVFETYPALALIALGWLRQDSRPEGRLPKYNPARKKTYSISDWQYVCKGVSRALRGRGLREIVRWIDDAARKTSPCKCDQDCLDACLCLLMALYLVERRDCLMVGDLHTGYIVVPYSEELYAELHARCTKTGRVPSDWVRSFKTRFVSN